MNGVDDLTWGPIAKSGTYDTTKFTCSGNYCHGATLVADAIGFTSNRTPTWTTVDGSQKACGTSCHTLPPGGSHPKVAACEACHDAVVSSFKAGNPPTITWANADLHVNGKVEVVGGTTTCTSCHGDTVSGNPAPPRDTANNTGTTFPGVGAHAAHLAAVDWHRTGSCADCHATPAAMSHSNGVVDFAWSAVSKADASNPVFVTSNNTCTNAYCHGTTLLGAKTGGTVNRTPTWNVVNNTFDACGTTCHTNPPGGTHPASDNCVTCHTAVISSFTPGTNAAVWANKELHINGQVEVTGGGMNCTSCHGDTVSQNPAPPRDTAGNTATTFPGVGAHAGHLAASTWHRDGVCADCHSTPGAVAHSNGVVDFTWGAVSKADNANPAFVTSNNTCTNAYCHGTTLLAAKTGGTVNRTPTWNVVNGSFDACGSTCHTNPPGGTHPANTNCVACHNAVVTSFNATTNATVWANKNLHINGIVEVTGQTCTTCHGDTVSGNPAPPKDTAGNVTTTFPGVGAHAAHLTATTWHRTGVCADCHTTPTSMTHANNVIDFSWGAVSKADNTNPAFVTSNTTCTNTYCHGASLLGAKTGGTISRTPTWNVVNNSFDACGVTCHTNPPGGTHPTNTNCAGCHAAVVTSFNAATNATVWANKDLHIDGKVDVSPMTCSSCHGSTTNAAPPTGVAGETLPNTLAVGRHQKHIIASASHTAMTCATCHTLPAAGDTTHAAQYQASATLATAGHHGDVVFTGGPANGMTWNVNAVQGNPVTARGTCAGKCHSNGQFSTANPNGGAPIVTAYWAGGTWPANPCAACHAATPTTGEHNKHVNGEGFACTQCHPGANTSTHMNGTKDMKITVVNSGGCQSGRRCSAPGCHGGECW